MVKLLYILSVCAMLAAGGVFGILLSGWTRHDARLEEFLNRPSAVERFGAQGSESGEQSVEEPPLVVQAKALALLLNPPKSAERPSAAAGVAAKPSPGAPAVRPAAPSVRFKLCGTSYYPNEPQRSMALISDVGAAEGSERWVKEGAQVGHFVIHEIRRGVIVYRDGEQLREMAVEHGASMPSIVRDTRSGSRKVSTAVDDAEIAVPALAIVVRACHIVRFVINYRLWQVICSICRVRGPW